MKHYQMQELYKDFIQSAVEAIIFTDFNGEIILWNKGSQYLFGYTKEEIKEYSLFSLLEVGFLDSFMSLFEAVKKGRNLCGELPCKIKSGEIIETRVTGGLLDEKGLGVLYFIIHDISHVKDAFNKLDNLMLFRNNSSDFILEWHKKKGIVYFNEAVKDYFNEVDVDLILPKGYQEHLNKIAGTDRVIEDIETSIGDKIFSYRYAPFKNSEDKVLIVGKDITYKIQLRDKVELSNLENKSFLYFGNNLINQLKYIELGQEADLLPILNLYIKYNCKDNMLRPTHILFLLENKEHRYEGFVVYREESKLEKLNKTIFVSEEDLREVLPQGRDILFKNASNFSSCFPEIIRDNLPKINNFVSCKIKGEREGVIIAFNYPKELEYDSAQTIKSLVFSIESLYSIQNQFKEKMKTQFSMIIKMAEFAEKRDLETAEHLKRIRNYARVLAEELSLQSKYVGVITEKFIDELYNSSPLHDIGKVGISDSVLQKPGKLSEIEYETVRQHPVIGGQILEGASLFNMARDIAYYHHEKFDGTGYPYGLKGENIPLAARIVAVADVYDAMTSQRVYKEPLSHERTKKLISICSGGHFDPDVVKAFLEREQDFIRIKSIYRG